jgi:hypothetical protein
VACSQREIKMRAKCWKRRQGTPLWKSLKWPGSRSSSYGGQVPSTAIRFRGAAGHRIVLFETAHQKSWSNYGPVIVSQCSETTFGSHPCRVVSVTAEAAGSSPVVPAIHSTRVVLISPKRMRVQKGAVLHPVCTSFRRLERFLRVRPFRLERVYAAAVELA